MNLKSILEKAKKYPPKAIKKSFSQNFALIYNHFFIL